MNGAQSLLETLIAAHALAKQITITGWIDAAPCVGTVR